MGKILTNGKHFVKFVNFPPVKLLRCMVAPSYAKSMKYMHRLVTLTKEPLALPNPHHVIKDTHENKAMSSAAK